MKTGARIAFGLAACMALANPPGASAATGDFLACAGEKDDARRLACFDAAVVRNRAGTTGTTEAAPVVASAAAAAPALSKEEKFGLRGDLKQEKAKVVPELVEMKELTAQVTKVAVKPHGELVLTLDNGQVWYEIQTSSGIRVKAGDQVTIKAGALGSYSLVAPNGRSSKVTRSR
jgi:hypothetical protein